MDDPRNIFSKESQPDLSTIKKTNILDEEAKFDFLQGRYLFRFPFAVTSLGWGLGLGSLFSLHNYLKNRDPRRAFFWFFASGFFSGMTIFGFFFFKYTFYNISLKKFEKDQTKLIRESDMKKRYYTEKLGKKKVDEKNDDELLEDIEKAQLKMLKEFEKIDRIVLRRDFD